MEERILVSACLLGLCCRYDGASKPNQEVLNRLESQIFIPVCPEQLGGLATPRVPSEIQGEKVVTKTGVDVTEQYERGAAQVLELAWLYGCKKAVLKAKSPSCGKGQIYDGTFSGTLTEGNGVTARLLLSNGIAVYTEHDLELLKQKDFVPVPQRAEAAIVKS